MSDHPHRKAFATLGLFIIDDFDFLTADGKPTGQTREPQIGGGGTYAAIGARIWLSPHNIGQIVDRGHDFPAAIQEALDDYGGEQMFVFRDAPERATTRAVNRYTGELRDFEYLTPRVRISPKDTLGTLLERARMLHFVCSPTRAAAIMHEVEEIGDWEPRTIYEPIPFNCTPADLPALVEVLPKVSILSPNADEALSLLYLPSPPTKSLIEQAATTFLSHGVRDAVIIRSGALGAYLLTRDTSLWVPAFWSEQDTRKVVDVTGAGNAFLGGLAGGLHLTDGNLREAVLYASVSASFAIEQEGLPRRTGLQFRTGQGEMWNDDIPRARLTALRDRVQSASSS
ncbi:Ribokinase-like protein [Auricularia subglabra TFB-10046 SS5]|nr:Ribokinase-like protein [Auricularia subglabra TFB-10046 SS5]